MPESAAPPDTLTLVFVYGTLWTRSGYRTARTLARHCLRDLGPAWIAARLYDLGRYPAAVPARHAGERVHGRLCALTAPQSCLPRLDAYEDCDTARPDSGLYRRERIVAHVERLGHRAVPSDQRWCWVYFFNGRLIGRPRIAHGDYFRWLAS